MNCHRRSCHIQKGIQELISTGTIHEIRPSDVWYEEREEFWIDQIGVPLISHDNHGFKLLRGSPVFAGEILGGCIDTIYDFFYGDWYADMPVLCEKYHLFPDREEWKGKILLLETSEETMVPEKYRKALLALKQRGVFDVASGVLCGKPMNEIYAKEYRQVLKEVIDIPELSVVWNVNIGHAQPRCIIPLGQCRCGFAETDYPIWEFMKKA